MSFHEPLSIADRLFLDVEDERDPMHVAGCFVFEAETSRGPIGGVDFEHLRDYVASRLPKLPRYRQRLATTPLEGNPIWVDDHEFNLDYHLRHTHLPVPGDERQLKRLVGRIISERLDLTKPLWELWVVEGLEGGRFALIAKVHHCMVDGAGGVQILQALLRPQPDTDIEAARDWFARKRPSAWRLGYAEIKRRIERPVELARLGIGALASDPLGALRSSWGTLVGLGEIARLDARPASPTLFNHRHGPHRRFDWWEVDLQRIRDIRKELGGTLNDVVITAVTGAVQRFLMQRGHSRGQLAALDFRIACPVNTRSGADDLRDIGNHVSMLIARVPLAEPDPRKRHQAVCKAFLEVKQSHQVDALAALQALGEWTSPRLNRALVRREARRHTSNLIVTNVRGPNLPLYLLGSRLLAPYPVVPLMPEQSLAIALFSYAGRLYWGFNSDWDLLPDLHDFVDDLEASVCELETMHRPGACAAEGARAQPRISLGWTLL